MGSRDLNPCSFHKEKQVILLSCETLGIFNTHLRKLKNNFKLKLQFQVSTLKHFDTLF